MMEEAWLEHAKATCEEIAENFAALEELAPWIVVAAEAMVGALEAGNKVIFCGNGGSAADSQHLAAEMMGRYLVDRKPLAAVALTTDTSALTAIGNDYDFGQVFARQLRGVGKRGDVLVALSTSGESENVIEAAKAARDMGIKVVSMTGADGGQLAGHADTAIKVPAGRADRIQEMHIAAGHILCEIVEATVGQ